MREEETFERKYIEKEVRKPADRAALWLSGALAAGMGYNAYHQGRVALGRDLHREPAGSNPSLLRYLSAVHAGRMARQAGAGQVSR